MYNFNCYWSFNYSFGNCYFNKIKKIIKYKTQTAREISRAICVLGNYLFFFSFLICWMRLTARMISTKPEMPKKATVKVVASQIITVNIPLRVVDAISAATMATIQSVRVFLGLTLQSSTMNHSPIRTVRMIQATMYIAILLFNSIFVHMDCYVYFYSSIITLFSFYFNVYICIS